MSKTKTFSLTVDESGWFLETNIYTVKATSKDEAEKIFFSDMDERTAFIETVDLDLNCDEKEITEIREEKK
jgi:hypothetical protein